MSGKPKWVWEKGAVWDRHGNTIGYCCEECGEIRSSMFGDICNACREKERRHKELISTLNKLPKFCARATTNELPGA